MTDEEIIRQVHQAIFGVRDTDAKGMVRDIQEIKQSVEDVRSDQNKLNNKVNNLIWYMAGSGLLGGGIIAKLMLG